MKRYQVFLGDIHYPRGGWKDHSGLGFDMLLDAEKYLVKRIYDENLLYDWAQIVDMEQERIVVEEHRNV